MSGSNRLLDMFHRLKERRGSGGAESCSLSMAPSHGNAQDFGGGSRHAQCGVTRAGGKSKLQRENDRLREQLKFQGAVLDQLAGDVHNLELQRDEDAVRLRLGPQLPLEPLETTNQSGSPCEEVRETDGENGCRTHDLVASTTFARVLNSRDSGAREQGREENALLRSNLREARRHAEGLRRRLTTEQKKAENTEQAHVELISRERKFRAAVEAGLREKVHSMRRRSRDTEERLASELAFVKNQLKEVIDVLATKEEEASLATKRNYELEEVSAEAQAKLKELDRHASWLERRLAEVSAGEASTAHACMEEMAASVVAQQRELESLRAISSNGQARHCKCSDRELTDLGKDVKMDEVAWGVDAQSENVGGIVTRPDEDLVMSSPPLKGPPHTKNMHQKRGGRAEPRGAEGPVFSIQPTHQAYRDRVEPEAMTQERAAGLRLVHRCIGTDETTLGTGCDAVNKDQPEVIASDVWRWSPGASEEVRSEQMLQLVEWLISPPAGDNCASPFGPLVDAKPPHCGFRDDVLQSLRERMQTNLSTAASRKAGKVLSTRNNDLEQQRTEWELKEAAWREQAVRWEDNFKIMHKETAAWEKETVALRVERQAILRRVAKAEKDAAIQISAVQGELANASTLNAELNVCRGNCKKLRREVSQRLQARRALEARAKYAEASLADALSTIKKAERAKTLLKARLAGAFPRKKDKSSAPASHNDHVSLQSPPTTDACCQTLDDNENHRQHRQSLVAKQEPNSLPINNNGDHRQQSTPQPGVVAEMQEGQCADRKQGLEIVMNDCGISREENTHYSKAQVKRVAAQLQTLREQEAASKPRGKLAQAQQAWQVLAEKVVSLADRNADLEQAILHLQHAT